jgi:cyclophilin family peptidyl-prolyl cis-trans isomerase
MLQHGLVRISAFLVLLVLPAMLQAQQSAGGKKTRVEIGTTVGNIVVELSERTPVHRDNFLQLVKEGFYDSLLFHRVIPGFMIQGGDPATKHGEVTPEGAEENTLTAEIVPGMIHRRGALAAAREGDDINPERRSSGSQFYIVQGRKYSDSDLDRLEERSARFGDHHTFTDAERQVYATLGGAPHLDGTYTVFGHVVEGMAVVDAIAAMPVDVTGRPVQEVRMFMKIK